MRRTGWVAAALAVGGLVVLSGFVGRGGCHGGRSPERMARWVNAYVDDTLDDLKATDAQRKSIHGVVDGLVTEAQGLREGHEAARTEVLGQWNLATPDASRVHAVVDARLDTFRAFAHKVADAGLQIHAVLTPEQRAEVGERIAEHHR